ncbi:MAG TPA: ribosomal protein S18-alanine N-acetyltransferase [Candidatus Hydrogenedentes bacterium]|nr:ribosomal protein S18-alanine N-acetyltransferase [Candidatus Hydrogenedentota bacterium]
MAASEHEPLSFSRLAPHHIPLLIPLETESYPEPWTFNMFLQEVSNENSRFFLMFEGSRLAGYGGFWLLMDEIHITRVTIAPSLRGRGLAKSLMEYLFKAAHQCGAHSAWLEVRASNLRAIRLYEGLGFVHKGCRKAYYQRTNEDAMVMARTIGTDIG